MNARSALTRWRALWMELGLDVIRCLPVLLAASLASCAVGPVTLFGPPPVQPLTLGVVLPLSGPDGLLGQAMAHGVELAVRQNAVPAKGFQLIVRQIDEASASAAQSVGALANDSTVVGVIGPLDNTTAHTLVPVIEQQHLAAISPGVLLSSLTQPNSAEPDGVLYPSLGAKLGSLAMFELAAPDAIGKVAASVAVAAPSAQGLGARSVFVVTDGSAVGQAQAAAFVQALVAAGGSTIGTATVPSGDKVSAQVAAIAIIRAQPDAVFYAGGTQSGAELRRAVTLTGAPQMTILATAPIAANPGWSADVGEAAASAYTVAVMPAQLPANSAAASAFMSAYHAAFGQEPPPQAALTYDATMDEIGAIKALLAAGKHVTRDAVLAHVASASYTGLTGTLAFDASGVVRTHLEYGVYSCDGSGNWKQVAIKQG